MKTAFSSFVFGSYERFIPFYIYSINKTYPESDIVIFYQGELSEPILKVIKNYPKVILHDNFYADKLQFKNYKMRGGGGGLSLLRFLISEQYFKDYDYAYFGDIDIMILKESESLFDFHLEQAKHSKVPFSNKVRLFPEGGLSKRLTGLHFVEVKPYFEKIEPIINRVLSDENYRGQFLEGIKRDEEFLYKLNKEAFDFNAELISKNSRPWHGFHLGLVRGKDYLNEQTIIENSSISIENLKDQLADFNNDGSIDKLLLLVNCIEVYDTYGYLKIPLAFQVKLKYQFRIGQDNFIKNLKKIKAVVLNG